MWPILGGTWSLGVAIFFDDPMIHVAMFGGGLFCCYFGKKSLVFFLDGVLEGITAIIKYK